MAGISKAVPAQPVSENRYNTLNLGEPLHLQTQVESHVEPYELVELFYGSHSVSSTEHNSSPTSPQTPPPQLIYCEMAECMELLVSERSLRKSSGIRVIEQPQKSQPSSASYKCEICGRVFKEASHFSKHKRGALCRKSAQKLAKKNRKRPLKEKECAEKKTKALASPYKPYQCTLCGAKFLDKVNVELHLERTHQTRQPLWLQTSRSGGFACSECDLWFADKTQLRQHQHQQQHSIGSHPTFHSQPHQADPSQPTVQTSLPHQPTMPPPPPPQYYFQPLQHIPTFNTNQMPHQLGVPPSHQNMQQQMSPQMGPPQGVHPVPTFVVPHPQNTPSMSQASIHHHHHQPIMQNNCLNAPPQMPLSSSNNVPMNSFPVEPSPKPLKSPKGPSYSNNWTTSRRNICGECGLKFVDPINLELHMQRKHPTSSIVETVGLGGGLTLYKTNTSSGSPSVTAPADSQVEEEVSSSTKVNNNQTFDCVLCGFKAPSMGRIVKHLQDVHNTNNANFIYPNLAGNSSSDEKQMGHVKEFSTTMGFSRSEEGFENHSYKCDSCTRSYDSRAALIKHTMKERNFLCGVCNFSSCSDARLASHMYSSHRDECGRSYSPEKDTHSSSPATDGGSDFTLTETTVITGSLLTSSCESSSPTNDEGARTPRLSCSVCDFYAPSGVALAQHLESHGSVRVTCGKCGEFGPHFLDIHNHIGSAHPGEVTRVSLSMNATSPNSPPSVYMFMITPPFLQPPSDAASSGPQRTDENESEGADQTEEDEDDENEEEESDDKSPSGEEHYACSDCGTCLTGSGQLEAHIARHQFPNSSALRPGGILSTQGDQMHLSSSAIATHPNPLGHRRGTLEFRCHECGFWRVRSAPVLRHIQAVHMSGGIIHSRRLKTGRIKAVTIRVFTPLSPLVLG